MIYLAIVLSVWPDSNFNLVGAFAIYYSYIKIVFNSEGGFAKFISPIEADSIIGCRLSEGKF